MASDGSIIIDTRINTEGFGSGAANMKEQFGKLGGVVKKLGVAIGATFAVKKLIDFGKEAINLGSDLQEVENVVDVTFTTLSDKVDQFAKSAAQSAGLSETMAKRYTGTFGAMAKSFQFTEEEAFGMSTALTQLTGDVASFYNISQDEAYTKLKSVFTGETESLKDLGVVMTQSALDAYAMANGFGKTTSAMTEQEKVALRYQFVMNQLSAASGDFIRTSDGWANQVRILKLQFDSLKATIGQGLINLFTPVIKVINILLSKLSTLANSFKAFTELITGKKSGSGNVSSISDGYNEAVAGAENLASSTEDAAQATKDAEKAAKGYLSPLDEINKMSSDESAGGSGTAVTGGSAVDYGSLEEGETIVDKTTKSFSELLAIFQPLKDAWAEYGDEIKQNFKNIGTELKEFGKQVASSTGNWFKNMDWEPLFESVSNLLGSMSPLLQSVGDWLLKIYEEIVLPFFKNVIEKHLPAFINLIASVFSFLSENQWLIEAIGAALVGAFAAGKIAPAIGAIITAVKGIVSIMTGAGGLSGAISAIVKALGGPLTLAIAAAIAIITLLITNWDSVKIWMEKFDKWLSEIFAHDWTKTFGVLGDSINAFMKTSKQHWDSVKQTFNGVITFIKGVFTGNWRQAWEGIKQILAGVWNGMVAVVKAPINGIIGLINGMINAIVSGLNHAIDAINRLHITVPDWVPVFGGESWGVHLSHISTPRIPYLAQGAVIPPNAPFMAMLGDQKNGNNLEMPESLLRRIVREETGGSKGGTQRFIAQINRRVLFDEMITEGKMRQSINGQNPFELA